MRSRIGLVILVISSVSCVHAAHALTLVDLERSVEAASTANLFSTASQEDQAASSSGATGPFLEASVTSATIALLSQARSEALQDSSVRLSAGGALIADGSGSVIGGVDVDDPGFASRAGGSALASAEIVFELTDPAEYVLAVSVLADLVDLTVVSGDATATADLLARFSLVGAASGEIASGARFDDAADGMPVEDDFFSSGVLAPDLYVLLLESSLQLEATEDAFASGTAGYGFDFRVVPEPGTGSLLLAGLVALVRRRRALLSREPPPD